MARASELLESLRLDSLAWYCCTRAKLRLRAPALYADATTKDVSRGFRVLNLVLIWVESWAGEIVCATRELFVNVTNWRFSGLTDFLLYWRVIP